MVAGILYSSPSAIFRMVPRKILPERGLGQALDRQHRLEHGDRADFVAHQLNDLLLDDGRIARDPSLQQYEAGREDAP